MFFSKLYIKLIYFIYNYINFLIKTINEFFIKQYKFKLIFFINSFISII